VFAEAAAAVYGEPDQYLMAEQEVMKVEFAAVCWIGPGCEGLGAEGDEQGDGAQAAAMSLEERRLRLEERRLQMEEQC